VLIIKKPDNAWSRLNYIWLYYLAGIRFQFKASFPIVAEFLNEAPGEVINEITIVTITADFEDRLKSYRLLSEAYNLN